MEREDPPDRAAVRIFPPGVPVVAILAGVGLDRLWPVEPWFDLPAAAHY